MLNNDYLFQVMLRAGSQELMATAQSLAKSKPFCLNVLHLDLLSLVQSFFPVSSQVITKTRDKSLYRLFTDRL